jgi:hypothetical protein
MASSPLNSSQSKHAQLRALGQLRQQTRWPGYSGIGDYHNGAYECDWVSPYTKTAGNVDAAVMLLLQDWASDEWCKGPFDPETAELGYSPSEPTNRNLVRLLHDTFGLSLKETYGTNLFPFVKSGGMSADIPMSDLTKAATDFALPQIAIVKPRLVICLGLATFTTVSLACGQSVPQKMATAIESPFPFEDSLIYCQSHPGHFGRINRNKGGVDRVSQDWVLMREKAGLH